MKTTNPAQKKYIFFVINIALPIVSGAIFYVTFRQNSYISQAVYNILRIKSPLFNNGSRSLIYIFANCFLCDILWAYALTFSVFSIIKKYRASAALCIIFEVLTELMQKTNIISGTFDIFDIISEFAATFIALYAIKLFIIKEKTK